jgi:acyl carrier protein
MQKEINNIEVCLRDLLAELMEVDPQVISTTSTFSELGVDSLVGLRFVRRVRDVVGVEIELESVFDYPTLAQLAFYVQDQQSLLLAEIE